LTRQGVALALLGLGLLALGRILGLVELYIVGAAALGACVLAVLMVWLRKIDLDVNRHLQPPRVAAGTASRVDLEVRNLSRRTSPVLRMRDEISGTRGADLLLAPLPPGGQTHAAYRLPTTRRGLVDIGPLSFEYSDPLGLARARVHSPLQSQLTVLPPVIALPPIPRSITDNPMSGAEQRASWSRSNGDFYALRDYVIGDDLRRVHWASTARHDELMVRQDELPWQGRLTVLIDNRRQGLDHDSLDLATSYAASVLSASRLRSDLVRLVTSSGLDSGFVTGNAPWDAVMEHLAVINGSAHGSLRTAVETIRQHEAGGAAVIISGMLSQEELGIVQGLATRFKAVIPVQIHPSAADAAFDDITLDVTNDLSAGAVTVTRSKPFAEQWTRTVSAMSASRS